MNRRLGTAMTGLLLLASPAGGEWYTSNAIATMGDQITQEQIAEYRYVLSVDTADGVEIQTLYVDGEPESRTEIRRDGSGRTETDYQQDEVRRLRRSDSQDLLLWEELYAGGELQERREYAYRGLDANLRTVYDATGSLLFREEFNYWRDGTLRSVIRSDANDTRTEYRYRNGQLEEEWISRGLQHERFKFDSAGRMVQRQLESMGELVEQETRRYWGADSGAIIREVVVAAGNETRTRRHDESGRLVEETEEIGGVTVMRRVRTYDDGRLRSKVEYSSGEVLQWSYEYSENQDLLLTRYLENDALVKTTLHITGEPGITEIEDLYRDGGLAIRVRYNGQQRVSEEVFRDGEIIRTRLFDEPDTGAGQ